MFDGAGVVTGVEAAQEALAEDQAQAEGDRLIQALARASEDSDDPVKERTTENAAAARSVVVFVDRSVEGHEDLVADLGSSAEVIYLNQNENGLTQMANSLEGRRGITAIHVISHGAVGEVRLGNSPLNLATLELHEEALAVIRDSLSEQGDILLYGCNVGANGDGQAFVEALAETLEADIAASDDLTGATDLGGDWEFEVKIGAIENDILVSDAAREAFDKVLVNDNKPTLGGSNFARTVSDSEPHNLFGAYSSINLNDDYNKVKEASLTITGVQEGDVEKLTLRTRYSSNGSKISSNRYTEGQDIYLVAGNGQLTGDPGYQLTYEVTVDDDGDVVILFTDFDTTWELNHLLRQIHYVHESEHKTDGLRKITLSVTDTDSAGNEQTNANTKTANMTVDGRPIVEGGDRGLKSREQLGDGVKIVDSSLNVLSNIGDAEGQGVKSIKITLGGAGHDPTTDSLQVGADGLEDVSTITVDGTEWSVTHSGSSYTLVRADGAIAGPDEGKKLLKALSLSSADSDVDNETITITIEATDAFDRVGSGASNILVDAVDPVIESAEDALTGTSVTWNKIGDDLEVTLRFNEQVYLTGSAVLTLRIGETEIPLITTGDGEGATELTFTSDALPDGLQPDEIELLELTLEEDAKLVDQAGNNADLGVGTIDLTADIDTKAPTITKITALEGDGSYKEDDELQLQVWVDEDMPAGSEIILTLNNQATVTLTIKESTTPRLFSGTYKVVDGDNVAKLSVDSVALGNDDAAPGDGAGNALSTILAAGANLDDNRVISLDTSAPTVVDAVNPQSVQVAKKGDSLSIVLRFSEIVTLDGRATLTLDVGGREVIATTEGGSARSLTFSTDAATLRDLEDGDGVSILANSLKLLGQSRLRDGADNAVSATFAQIDLNNMHLFTKIPEAPSVENDNDRSVVVSRAARGVPLIANLETPKGTDITHITLTIPSVKTGDHIVLEQDKLVDDTGRQTVDGIDLLYAFDGKTLRLSRADGDPLAPQSVKTIVEAVNLQSSRPGEHRVTVSYSNSFSGRIGNSGETVTATLTITEDSANTVSSENTPFLKPLRSTRVAVARPELNRPSANRSIGESAAEKPAEEARKSIEKGNSETEIVGAAIDSIRRVEPAENGLGAMIQKTIDELRQERQINDSDEIAYGTNNRIAPFLESIVDAEQSPPADNRGDPSINRGAESQSEANGNVAINLTDVADLP